MTAEDLSRWLAEAAAQLSADARAAVVSLGSAAAAERGALHGLCGELRGRVSELGRDLDAFMRRQAIKVDTQVCGMGCGVWGMGCGVWSVECGDTSEQRRKRQTRSLYGQAPLQLQHRRCIAFDLVQMQMQRCGGTR